MVMAQTDPMRTLAISATLLFALSACGGGDDEPAADPSTSAPTSSATTEAATEPTTEPTEEPSSPETSTPADDPEARITERFIAYSDAFFGGDGAAAYEILSDRCREATPLSEFASISEQATETYGAVDPTVDSIEVDGDSAIVQATLGISALDDAPEPTEPNWVLENGDWFSDKCD